MRALTLTAPWAGLVASGIKLVENRPRRMIKATDFGKPFAIHASREISAEAEEQIAAIAPELLTIARNVAGGMDRFYADSWSRLGRVTSAVIGVATIDRVIRPLTEDDYESPEAGGGYNPDPHRLGDQQRWFFGPVGYVLRDVRALARPVECRGWQGFWTLPEGIAVEVMDQVGGAR